MVAVDSSQLDQGILMISWNIGMQNDHSFVEDILKYICMNKNF